MTTTLRPRQARTHPLPLRSMTAALMLSSALPCMAGDIDQITTFRNLSFTQTADGNRAQRPRQLLLHHGLHASVARATRAAA